MVAMRSASGDGARKAEIAFGEDVENSSCETSQIMEIDFQVFFLRVYDSLECSKNLSQIIFTGFS